MGMDKHKITTGFVTQVFRDGACVSQYFIAHAPVNFEDEQGKSIDPWDEYFPYEMVQPDHFEARLDYLKARLDNVKARAEQGELEDIELKDGGEVPESVPAPRQVAEPEVYPLPEGPKLQVASIVCHAVERAMRVGLIKEWTVDLRRLDARASGLRVLIRFTDGDYEAGTGGSILAALENAYRRAHTHRFRVTSFPELPLW